MANVYDKNATMKLLGYQYFNKILSNDSYHAMQDLIKARPGESNKDMAYDCFTLGYIYGKRAERRKKRAALAKN